MKIRLDKFKRWAVELEPGRYHWEQFYTKSAAMEARQKILIDKVQVLRWIKTPHKDWGKALDKIKVVKL